jgi:ribosomal protein L11 methyltransferase
MSHTQVTFLISPVTPWREILIAELGELGYESFEEGPTDPGGDRGELRAWIRSADFDASAIGELMALRDPHAHVSWTSETIAPRNWNAEWERDFNPVEVGGVVRVRAPFHAPDPSFAHDLEVLPGMAFGTGHHATTRMMVEALLQLAGGASGTVLAGREVCDLGCGTGVLAILAERLGAKRVRAVEIDPVAVESAQHNIQVNGCTATIVEKGDAHALEGLSFDVILANIERNVLLDAMPLMSAALRPGGSLFLSGFSVADRHMLAERAKQHGLVPHLRMNEGEWALLGCQRPG